MLVMQLPVSRLSGSAIWGDGDVLKTRETYQESQPHVAMQEATITTIDIFFLILFLFPGRQGWGTLKSARILKTCQFHTQNPMDLWKKKRYKSIVQVYNTTLEYWLKIFFSFFLLLYPSKNINKEMDAPVFQGSFSSFSKCL